MQKLPFCRENGHTVETKVTFHTSSDLWVLLFNLFIFISAFFEFARSKPSCICRTPSSSESQSSVSMAVLSHFHCSGVPGHVSHEAVLGFSNIKCLPSLEVSH